MEAFTTWAYPILVGLLVGVVSGVVAGVLVGRKVNSSRASTLFKWSDSLSVAHTLAEERSIEADQKLSDFNKEFSESLTQFTKEPTLENSNRSIIMGLAGMAHVVESTFRWSQKNLFLTLLASLYAHASAYDADLVRKLYNQDQDITFAQMYADIIAMVTIMDDEHGKPTIDPSS